MQPPPMATVMEKLGGVRALVVGGCCELNTTAHELIVEIGSEMGGGSSRRICGARSAYCILARAARSRCQGP